MVENDYFLVTGGPKKEEKFLMIGMPMIIGRQPPADVVIQNESVSRRHLKISASPLGFMIEDLGSSNGTFLNEEKVSTPRVIRNGDRVRLGFEVELHFVLSGRKSGGLTPQVLPDGSTGFPSPEATLMQEPLAAASFGDMLGAKGSGQSSKAQTPTAPRPNRFGLGGKDPKKSGEDTVITPPENKKETKKSPPNLGMTIMSDSIMPSAASIFQLVVNEPGKKPKAYKLLLPKIRIGRLPDNDVVIDNTFVSRYHAELERRGEDYFLLPMPNVRNALLLNGKAVTEAARLVPGMQISVGGWGPGEMTVIDFLISLK